MTTILADPAAESPSDRYARLRARLLQIPWCPWTPNPGPQSRFLLDFSRESLYGGAAGGGKSIALLMAASQFLDVPTYAAILFRKSYKDLTEPGALLDIAATWWGGNRLLKYDREKATFFFPTFDPAFYRDQPAAAAALARDPYDLTAQQIARAYITGRSSVTFAYLANENDRFNYQGAQFQMCAFDELTQHRERDYRYLFSRVRKPSHLAALPLRMRATTNPGGVHHAWVERRFVIPYKSWKKAGSPTRRRPRRNFHPAFLSDNPKLDYESYVAGLMQLDPVTREQLLRGDWEIRPDGRMFKRSWFRPIPLTLVPHDCQWVRYWDLAATEPDVAKSSDPDWTAGCLLGRDPRGNFYLADMQRWQREPSTSEMGMRACAFLDSRRVPVRVEKEGGAEAKYAIRHFRNNVFPGFNFHGIGVTGKGKKVVRAAPVASIADAGQLFMVQGAWNDDFLDEIELFPDSLHDDQVDALSGAYGYLSAQAQMISYAAFGGNGAAGAGDGNDLTQTNPWRPDVSPVPIPASHLSIAMSELGNQYKIDEARAAEKAIDHEARRANRRAHHDRGADLLGPKVMSEEEMARESADVRKAVAAAWSM